MLMTKEEERQYKEAIVQAYIVICAKAVLDIIKKLNENDKNKTKNFTRYCGS